MLLAQGGKILYVANANRNTVTVIDTAAGKAVETIGTAIDPRAPAGCTPSSLALTPDESVLLRRQRQYQQPGRRQRQGAGRQHAAGVHPDRLVSHVGPGRARRQDDLRANGKGPSSKANRDGPNPASPGGSGRTPRVHRRALPGDALDHPHARPRQMAAYSQTVYECSPHPPRRPDGRHRPQACRRATRSPARVGDPSPIKHCVYIIKENRTYDQVFGDMPEGNGEPQPLPLPRGGDAQPPRPGARVRAAGQLLRRGEVSADGHEWSMGAYATDFVERTWPLGYRGDRRVPYPVGGASSTIARPAGGYLWDRAAEKGVTYRSYGEFIENGKTPDEPGTTTVKALQGPLRPHVPHLRHGLPRRQAGRPVPRGAGRVREGRRDAPADRSSACPTTTPPGTKPGKPTVDGLRRRQRPGPGPGGRGPEQEPVLEGAGHLRGRGRRPERLGPRRRPPHAWPWRSARTSKRHSVDSTMYSTSSMLRTMELILGLEPMSQFDAAPGRCSHSFTRRPTSLPTRTARPASTSTPRTARRARGRGVAAAQPRDRRPRRRPALQRDHLEGGQGHRLADAAAGPGGVCGAEAVKSMCESMVIALSFGRPGVFHRTCSKIVLAGPRAHGSVRLRARISGCGCRSVF